MINLTDRSISSASHPQAASACSDVAALANGRSVLEYCIVKLLGGGGFGLTYLAHDINLDLPVALKEYFPGDIATRSAELVAKRAPGNAAQFNWGSERFLDEARALAACHHPNIARVLRYFKENDTAYIVMEYQSGEPLKRWLGQQKCLTQKALLQLIYPLLAGLESVHKLNFLHRDIKPDNIYIRTDGTPVLLDFGAARRVSADSDMTNIVSPCFAPFEQYHSHGNQGPWTDLYSLGAVMYWMTTGNKPMESAARVTHDKMPKAVIAANAGFSAALLEAIDWAMTPDETRRPQTVAEFRAALMLADDNSVPLGVPGSHRIAEQSRTDSDVLAFVASSQSIPNNQAESLRKNVLGTIMFVKLLAYPARSSDQQVALKSRFNALINNTLRSIAEASRIIIETDDGAAICFLGDPEEALQAALLLRSLLKQKYGRAIGVRIGLHLGPMRMVFDVNKRVNVVGDGINVAQRIMDFAKTNQILVSRAYYEVVSRIADTPAGLFSPLGPHLDPHMRSHDLYAVVESQVRNDPASVATVTYSFENTASYAAIASLTPEAVAEIEAELARLIGPLAKILVTKALKRAVTPQRLRDLVAVAIPDALARKTFLIAKIVNSQPTRQPGGTSSAPSRSDAHSDFPATSSGRAGVTTDGSPSSRPAKDASSPVNSMASTGAIRNPSLEQLAELEKSLSQFIGPMARLLTRKEATRHPSMAALIPALSLHINRLEDRSRFLASMQKLPRPTNT